MRIDKIFLKNFRNHTQYQVSPHKKINVFLGENGKGKTSILEACVLVLTGQSFRSREWIQEKKEEASVRIRFACDQGEGEILSVFSKNKPTRVTLNGKNTRKYPFKKWCVCFTPEDLVAIRGEASYRRKLMDDLVQNDTPDVVDNFYKILAQKNRFLKLCKQGEYSPADQETYRSSLQEIFLERSFDLIRARFKGLREIQPYWEKRGKSFLETPQFSFRYLSQKNKEATSPEQACEDLKKELKKKEVLERIQGYSLAGPQRHDLCFLYQEKEARTMLSQGQQKALLLSWKMAQWDRLFYENKAEKRETPCLFFDDVFSEIDQHFRKNLVEFLLENQAQSFVATLNWERALSSQEGLLFHLGTRLNKKAENDKNITSNDLL